MTVDRHGVAMAVADALARLQDDGPPNEDGWTFDDETVLGCMDLVDAAGVVDQIELWLGESQAAPGGRPSSVSVRTIFVLLALCAVKPLPMHGAKFAKVISLNMSADMADMLGLRDRPSKDSPELDKLVRTMQRPIPQDRIGDRPLPDAEDEQAAHSSRARRTLEALVSGGDRRTPTGGCCGSATASCRSASNSCPELQDDAGRARSASTPPRSPPSRKVPPTTTGSRRAARANRKTSRRARWTPRQAPTFATPTVVPSTPSLPKTRRRVSRRSASTTGPSSQRSWLRGPTNPTEQGTFPQLVVGMSVPGVPGAVPGANAIDALADMRRRGLPANILGGDRAYTNEKPENYRLPAAKLGYQLAIGLQDRSARHPRQPRRCTARRRQLVLPEDAEGAHRSEHRPTGRLDRPRRLPRAHRQPLRLPVPAEGRSR